MSSHALAHQQAAPAPTDVPGADIVLAPTSTLGQDALPGDHAVAAHLENVPFDTLSLISSYAVAHGMSLAATSRTVQSAVMHAAKAETLFELSVTAACLHIPGDDVRGRMRLVKRALRAGHRALLYTWPASDLSMSPPQLRTHDDSHGGEPDYTFPLEHNLFVHTTAPTDEDADPFMYIKSIMLFHGHGQVYSAHTAWEELTTVYMNLDHNSHFSRYHPDGQPLKWHAAVVVRLLNKQLCLAGKMQTAPNVRCANRWWNTCRRRMAIVLLRG